MKLCEYEANHFFDLMWSLQCFVNTKLEIIPGIKTLEKYTDCGMEEKFKVREAVFADTTIIDEFIQQNPQKFSQEDLRLVSNWKNFVAGKFFIERLLKKHTIFIVEEEVYAVLGLYQGLDEMFHPSHLPTCVEAILLPFNGKIIYDGLLLPYNIMFGSGIKRDLKECYMAARKTGNIITSLEPAISAGVAA